MLGVLQRIVQVLDKELAAASQDQARDNCEDDIEPRSGPEGLLRNIRPVHNSHVALLGSLRDLGPPPPRQGLIIDLFVGLCLDGIPAPSPSASHEPQKVASR